MGIEKDLNMPLNLGYGVDFKRYGAKCKYV